MHLHPEPVRVSVILILAVLGTFPTRAADTLPAGRYLDRSVAVHDISQLNPLRQVARLEFSDRITVAGAVRSALAGTGYQLLDPDAHDHPGARQLLESRIAVPHLEFDSLRIDSVVSAIVGAGRGWEIQVNHVSRTVRIVPAIFPEPRESVSGGQG